MKRMYDKPEIALTPVQSESLLALSIPVDDGSTAEEGGMTKTESNWSIWSEEPAE